MRARPSVTFGIPATKGDFVTPLREGSLQEVRARPGVENMVNARSRRSGYRVRPLPRDGLGHQPSAAGIHSFGMHLIYSAAFRS